MVQDDVFLLDGGGGVVDGLDNALVHNNVQVGDPDGQKLKKFKNCVDLNICGLMQQSHAGRSWQEKHGLL